MPFDARFAGIFWNWHLDWTCFSAFLQSLDIQWKSGEVRKVRSIYGIEKDVDVNFVENLEYLEGSVTRG